MAFVMYFIIGQLFLLNLQIGNAAYSDNNCALNQFSCGDGSCISKLWVCDRQTDCDNGLDEKACDTHNCSLGHKHCNDNTTCIPENWFCDGSIDCSFGEDEANCHSTTCKENEFHCDEKNCIDLRLKCDGVKHCRDGQDELNCTNTEMIGIPTRDCGSGMFKCPTDFHCIYNREICDDHLDCEDGSDEANCERKKCETFEFTCENTNSSSGGRKFRKCIPLTWKCDKENDCGDWSDEMGHCIEEDYNHYVANIRKPCSPYQFPCTSGECIGFNEVCDGVSECSDGSDEGRRCDSSCLINNGGCHQVCKSTPYGPTCECHRGYSMQEDGKNCHDIDECQHVGLCSHFCINTPGSYKCKCAESYELSSDKHVCKATRRLSALILFMLPDKIIGSNIVDFEEVLVAKPGVYDLKGMDYDHNLHLVFWSEQSNGRIMSSDLDSIHTIHSAPSTEVFKFLSAPQFIAWDWISKNMYFSDAEGYIQVCNYYSKNCSLLIDEPIHCSSLALAPNHGYIFWATPGGDNSEYHVDGVIERALLDGSERKVIVNHKIHSPRQIVVDQILERIYWTDSRLEEVSSCDFEGMSKTSIISYGLPAPFGLALFEDLLYVSNLGSNSTITVNKFSGTDKRPFHNSFKAEVVHVSHPALQPDGIDNCSNNTSCEHMCIPHGISFRCLCPRGKELSLDSHTCRDAPKIITETITKSASTAPVEQDQTTWIWLVIILLLVTVFGSLTLMTIVMLYKQGSLPKPRFNGVDISSMSVTFTPGFSNHGKDDEEILING